MPDKPVTMPIPFGAAVPEEKNVLRRLGYDAGLSERSETEKRLLTNAYDMVAKYKNGHGAWFFSDITAIEDDVIHLSDGYFTSKNLAYMLRNSTRVCLLGATIGNDVEKIIKEKVAADSGSEALIIDAVASESADCILDWLMVYINQQLRRNGERLTPHRFSAGYGDFKIENQKIIYDRLNMSQFGVELTERLILLPEKSVLAVAGVERIG